MAHGHDHNHGNELVLGMHTLKKLIIILMISVTLQLIGSLFAGSVSVFSDALHSAFDGLAYVSAACALFIAALSSKTSAWLYSLRQKCEWINKVLSHSKKDIVHAGNLISAMLLPLAAIYIGWEAISHLNNADHHEIHVGHALLFGSIGLIANILMRGVLKRALNKVKDTSEEAKTLKITLQHVKADLYHSMIVVCGMGIILCFGPQYTWIDPVLSLWLAMKMISWGKNFLQELTSGNVYTLPGGIKLTFPHAHHHHHH